MTSENQDKSLDLAIIGYSQAGKTTLAVGLYATSTEDFTVIGEGEDTENYLRSRKAMLETGHWLDATQERDRPELCLKIMRRGRTPAWIRFKEYMGELAYNSETYKRDVIGKPRGAIILLNPKMDILSDAIRRIEMLAQMREIVGYLASNEVGCEYVAVVTTASDLLEGCDAAFKENFDDYKAEVINAIKTSKFGEQGTWKEFAVTVSGKLEDVTRPRIARGADNTSRLPFVWIIDELEKKAKEQVSSRRMKHALIVASLAIGGLAIAFMGWFFGLDRMTERELARQTEEPVRLLKTAIDAEKIADINRNCSAIEKAVAQAESSSVFFSSNSNRLAAALHERYSRIDEGRIVAFPLRFEQMRRDAEQLAKEETCQAWRREYESWKPTSEKAVRQRQQLLNDFDGEVAEWRKAYEGRVYRETNEKLLAKLRNLKVEDEGAGNGLHGLLSECRRIEKNASGEEAFPLVAFSVRTSTWAVVRLTRDESLGRLIHERLSVLKPESPSRPELNAELRGYFEEVVKGDVMSQSDKTLFLNRIEGEVKSRQDAWAKWQNDECEKFRAELSQKKDAYDAVMAFRDFEQYHQSAPMFNGVVLSLHERVGSDFRRLVDEVRSGKCPDTKKNFMSTRELCEALLRVKCPAMKRSCWYRFAEDCKNKGKISDGIAKAFIQTYTVGRIEMKTIARSLYEKPRQTVRFQCCFTKCENGDHRNASAVKECEIQVGMGESEWNDLALAGVSFTGNCWNPVLLTVRGNTDSVANGYHRASCLGEDLDMGEVQYHESNFTGDDTDMSVHVRACMDVAGKAIWEYLPENTKLELE